MDQEEKEQSLFSWQILSDDILLNIFYYLPAATVIKVSEVCKTWYRVAFDEFLWKNLFYSRWKLPRSIPMAEGKESWMKEYKRLYFHTPAVESEVMRSHTDEVLRVCFSHNGKMFATSSKDGFIKVWNSSFPCHLKYEADMIKFACAHTWFSQFNESDTLLLVAGVYDRSLARGGEIVVFSLIEGFRMQRQVINESDQVLGAWYNDSYFLSGILRDTGTVTSSSTIWLNQTHMKPNAEQESLSKLLYRFLNKNNDCVRSIMIANVVNDTSGSLYKVSCGTTNTSHCKDGESKVVNSNRADNVQVANGKYSSYSSQRSITDVPVSERSRSVDHRKTNVDPETNNYESDFATAIGTNDSSGKKSVDLGSYKGGQTHTGCSYSFSLKASSDLRTTSSEVEDKMASTSIFDDVLNKLSSDALTEEFDLIKGQSLFRRRCLNDSQLNVPGPDSTDDESEIESDIKIYQREKCQRHAVVKTVETISVNVDRLWFPSDSNIQRNVRPNLNPKGVGSEVSACDKIHSNGNGLDISVTPTFVGPTCNEQFQPYPISEDDINDSESCKSDDTIFRQSVDKNTSITTSENDSTSLNSGADKYLIFKRGTETCIPHEVGIKLIRARKYLNPVTNQLLPDVPDNYNSLESDTYDSPEFSFNMHGHIIGMCLSPDHRYLYVNSRPWVKESQMENPTELPSLAHEIEIHVIDLVNLKELGKMQSSQRALMPGKSYIEIDLDVSQEYVASGAEDKHGYLWDRHYGICINKFPHSDIVNSVAINPADPEMLVTVSDDRSIKVWRSLNREKKLKNTATGAAREATDTPTR